MIAVIYEILEVCTKKKKKKIRYIFSSVFNQLNIMVEYSVRKKKEYKSCWINKILYIDVELNLKNEE